MDLEISSPAPHGVCIDLTHVPAPVHFPDVGDVQLPLLVLPVGEGDSLVPGDDAVVDGEDGLSVHSDPSNLVRPEVGDVAGEDRLSPRHHRPVLHAVRELRWS